jgi:hypothetical protein
VKCTGKWTWRPERVVSDVEGGGDMSEGVVVGVEVAAGLEANDVMAPLIIGSGGNVVDSATLRAEKSKVRLPMRSLFFFSNLPNPTSRIRPDYRDCTVYKNLDPIISN